MDDTELKLVLGSLLHDVGKVIYRKGEEKRSIVKAVTIILKKKYI